MKKSDWLDRLTSACNGITDKQAKEVIEHCRWVKIVKVNDDFEELFSKHKSGPFKKLSNVTISEPTKQ